MKRYWLFAGNNYYPMGGMEDFHNSYDTLEEAKKSYKVLHEEDSYEYAWAHVYDSETRSIDFDTNETNTKEDYKFL